MLELVVPAYQQGTKHAHFAVSCFSVFGAMMYNKSMWVEYE
jgi:hypothetical protein